MVGSFERHDREWEMSRYRKPQSRSVSSILIVASLLAGCTLPQTLAVTGAPYSVNTTIEYAPTGISRLSQSQLEPLAVYLLAAAPERASTPKFIGEITVLWYFAQRARPVV
jgi:hypothetical protein